MIESLCLYLLCLSAALLCYIGFQCHSLIRSTSCSCSTCCFGLGFQLQNLQDFINISRALIKDIFLQLATTHGHRANTELLRRLEDSVHTPLYYSALRPDSLPAHLQKPRLQLALGQLPLLGRYHQWYARRSIHVPARYTKCICGHAEEETWDHFKGCSLYRGLDTLTDWNPTPTIAQHAGWPTRSPATQQLATVLKQTAVLEAVRRGLVPTAVYTLLRTHAEDPQATAAHMQRTAITKTAEQLTYHSRRYLQHAAALPQTDQAHLLKLLFYQP